MDRTTFSTDGTGNQGGDIVTWSVSENVTPVAPGAPAAAAGGTTVTVDADNESDLLVGDEYTLTDTEYGTVSGRITNANLGPLGVSITGDNPISRLSATRTIAPILSSGHEQAWETSGTNLSATTTDPSGNVYLVTLSVPGYELRKYDRAGVQLASLAVSVTTWIDYDAVNNRVVLFDQSSVSYVPSSLSSVTSTFTNSNYVFYGQPVFHSGSQRFVASARRFPDSGFNIGIFSFPANFSSAVTVAEPHPFLNVGSGLKLYGSQASEVLHFSASYSSNATIRYITPSTGASTSYLVNLTPYLTGTQGSSLDIVASGLPTAVSDTTLELFIATIDGFVNGDGSQSRATIHRLGVYGRMDGFAIIDAWRFPDENAVGGSSWPRSLATGNNRLYVSRSYRRAYDLIDIRNVSLSSVFQSYIDSLNAEITLDYQATTDPYIAAPGWTDSVWTKLNELCVAYNVEIAMVDDVLTVRDVGSARLNVEDMTPVSKQVSLDGASRYVDIPYTNARAGVGTVYDAALDGSGRVFEIGVGEVRDEPISTGNFPVAVQQPQRTTSLLPEPGQYYLIGSDNLPVVAQQFEAYGGSVVVSVDPFTPGNINVRLTGPATSIPGVPGPYRLAISDGSNTYPRFSVIGTGVFQNPKIERISTGANWSLVSNEINSTASANPFMATREQAWTRGRKTAVLSAGPNASLSFSISHEDSNGFGLTSGSTFEAYNAKWRVDTASFGVSSVSVTASLSTSFADVQELWDGFTIGEFAEAWDGKRIKDFRIRPLDNTID